MASYVVMERPDAPDAVYVRDGFHVWAFLLGPVWLLWNRLWIEALLLLAAMLVIGAAMTWLGAPQGASFLSLLLSLLVGLEGPALRLAALRRRGWRDAGVVDAHDADEAEIRYLYSGGQAVMADPVERPLNSPSAPAGAAPRAPQAGPVLGLLTYPGSR